MYCTIISNVHFSSLKKVGFALLMSLDLIVAPSSALSQKKRTKVDLTGKKQSLIRPLFWKPEKNNCTASHSTLIISTPNVLKLTSLRKKAL